MKAWVKGAIVGFIVGILLEESLFTLGSEYYPLALYLHPITPPQINPFNPELHLLAIIIVLNIPPLMTLGQSILMNKKYPEQWGQVKIRATSVSSLLIGYCIGLFVIYSLNAFEGGPNYRLILGSVYFVPMMLGMGLLTIFDKGLFVYSGILTSIAVYYSLAKLENKRWMAIPILLMLGAIGFPTVLFIVGG